MSFLIDSSIMITSQILFFGFGWLFFMRQLFKDYEVLGPGLIHHWLPCSSACRRPIVGLRLVILTGGQGAGMAGAVNSERPELAKSTAEVQIQL
ncbi:hypothetical protein CK820_G0040642 [Pan troglodytes]|uniref:Uncharacterized protein n=1 Tax=Pan troglodytes TaxID=9598 RepID=A0A2J8K8Y3_PANTR|nr:hypothetical protein CK820_G0040642 [Pan troglodytes]